MACRPAERDRPDRRRVTATIWRLSEATGRLAVDHTLRDPRVGIPKGHRPFLEARLRLLTVIQPRLVGI